ncbi:MAG TPA: TlpA family protein disulfide reductase, partial [Myxococcaceae bacterium]|nr:TlpA family protein disulfide reductase [Myxococcaceae bacterium]
MSERSKSNTALWVLGGLMLAAALWQGIREARASWLLPKGGAAPLFSLQKFEGGTVNLADLHGQVVM